MSEGARPGWYQDPQGPADSLRYWDGERWTEHRQLHPAAAEPAADPAGTAPVAANPAGEEPVTTELTAVDPAAAEATAADSARHGARPAEAAPTAMASEDDVATGGIVQGIAVGLIIAVLALLLIAVTIGLPGSGEDSESSEAPSSGLTQSVPNPAGSTDGSPQELARSAQSAIEIYANDNGGSFADASPEDLAAIEPDLNASQIAVSSNETAFTVTAISGEAAFSISRAGNGTVTLSCEPPGRSGCPANGDWS